MYQRDLENRPYPINPKTGKRYTAAESLGEFVGGCISQGFWGIVVLGFFLFCIFGR